MRMHRFSENSLYKSSINKVLANSTQNGDAVDTFGYRRAALVGSIVTGAATTAQFKIQESADGSTGWADVTGTTQPATAQAASTPASGAAGVPYIVDVDLEYRERYLRICLIGTGAAGQATGGFLLFQGTNDAPTQDQTALHV